jgi:transcriptional regulator with XRE-family HTH domain
MSKESIKEDHNEQLAALGKGLKKLRKERGYSNYHKLAYDMDMIHSQYGAYENGKNLTILTLLKILDFHKISFRDFINEYFDYEK